MKLKLRSLGEVQILTVTDLDTSQSVQVMRAGVKKLLMSGKNKIVIELAEAAKIPKPVVEELGEFRQLATELAGDIVIAGLDKVKPAAVNCYANLDDAVAHFTKKAKGGDAQPKPAEQSGQPQKDPYKEEIRLRELGDAGALRREIERLKTENLSLNDLLSSKILDRRSPPDLKAANEKIDYLEGQLADILGKPPEKKA